MIKNNRELSVTVALPIIQFDDEGHFLFSKAKLGAIGENRNLDICVIDTTACAVVVVVQVGKIRFEYTGPDAESTSEKSFDLVSFTTDTTEARFQ